VCNLILLFVIDVVDYVLLYRKWKSGLASDNDEPCPPPRKCRQAPFFWNQLFSHYVIAGASIVIRTSKRGNQDLGPAHAGKSCSTPTPFLSKLATEEPIGSRRVVWIRTYRTEVCFFGEFTGLILYLVTN
jgi:hypothetical protein